MTTIHDMKPGPEMDARVAVEVMGWVRCGDRDSCKPIHVPSKDYPGSFIDDYDGKGPHPRLESPDGVCVYFCPCENTGSIPPYSTDMAAAWEVECEIERRDLHWEYADELCGLISDYVACDYFGVEWLVIHAAPEQRCKAALLAAEEATT